MLNGELKWELVNNPKTPISCSLRLLSALREKDVALRDMAILYRTNAQSRALEEVLKLGNLPYQIIGSVRFYERM